MFRRRIKVGKGESLMKNILLVFTDQQRFDTIRALGNPVIHTPVLDNMISRGTAFTRAYTPCPVCVPARFSMHTGLMPHRTECTDNHRMPENVQSFMQILAANGYQSHGVGKMHFVREDQLWGYESRDRSEEGGGEDDFKHYLGENGFDHVYDPHGVRSEMYYIPQPSQLPARMHHSTWVVDRSIEFLEHRDKSRPFFLMTSFIKPHPPFENPTPWNKLYRGPEMPLPKKPEGYENLITYWNRYQNRYKYRDQGEDRNLVRNIKAAYYGCISFIDHNLGRLLTHLDNTGLSKDTLILYTADHGEMLGDYASYGKRNFLDSAARIPLLMIHPDLPGGRLCDTPASLVDVMPTILEYAGIPVPKGLNGESLMALLAAGTRVAEAAAGGDGAAAGAGGDGAAADAGGAVRDTVFGQFQSDGKAMFMAVDRRYKYIYSVPDDKEWLYDHATDPLETINRAYNPAFKKQKDAMKKKLITYFQAEGYTRVLDGDDFKKHPRLTLPEDPDALLLFQDPPSSLPDIPGYKNGY